VHPPAVTWKADNPEDPKVIDRVHVPDLTHDEEIYVIPENEATMIVIIIFYT